MNAFTNPFQGAPVAVGEIHELLAEGLRIEAGVEGQGKGPGGQTLLEHAEPHAGCHHLYVTESRFHLGRVLPREPDRT